MSRLPSKEEIAHFCAPCDSLMEDGSCVLDQNRPADLIQITVKRKIESTMQDVKVDLCEIVDCESPTCKKYCANQLRYVKRDRCTWASVDQKMGKMTKYGFTPL